MSTGIVTGLIRVVALLLVLAGCSSVRQDAVEGVLPDGTVFAFTSTEIDPLDAWPDGIVLIDVPGEQTQAIGIHRYDRVTDSNVPPRPGAVVLQTESWLLVIDLYSEVESIARAERVEDRRSSGDV